MKKKKKKKLRPEFSIPNRLKTCNAEDIQTDKHYNLWNQTVKRLLERKESGNKTTTQNYIE